MADLVHHSDPGVQCRCRDYTQALKQHEIRISIASPDFTSGTENGDPYENALAERMNRTIKEEMLQNRRFPSFEEAREAIKRASRCTTRHAHMPRPAF